MVFKKPHIGFILSASLSHHKDVQGVGENNKGKDEELKHFNEIVGLQSFQLSTSMSSSIFARFPH